MDKKGFTLIELLVVIAIIGVLSSIILTNLSISRAKGDDSKRLQEVNEVETALNYMLDTRGHFACHDYQKDVNDDGTKNTNFLKGYTNANFLTAIPHDPTGGYYFYEYATYKMSPNSAKCGEGVFLGVYFENPGFHCPQLGFVALDGANHCHIWYPAPPPCQDFEGSLHGPVGNFGVGAPCEAYGDKAAQNEY